MLRKRIIVRQKKRNGYPLVLAFLIILGFMGVFQAEEASAQTLNTLPAGQRLEFSGKYYKLANPSTGMMVPELDLGKSNYHTTWTRYNLGYSASLIKPIVDNWYAGEFTPAEKAMMTRPAMVPDFMEMSTIRNNKLLPRKDTSDYYFTSDMGEAVWNTYSSSTNYYVTAYSESAFWDSYGGQIKTWAGPGAPVPADQTLQYVLPAIWLNGSTNFLVSGGVGVIAPADSDAPVITLSPSTVNPTNGNVTVTSTVTDVSGVSVKKWAYGNQSVAYFASSGNTLGATFSADVNGVYTVYAKDVNGNQGVKTITISVIDKVLPTGTITASTTGRTNGTVTLNAVGSDTGGSSFSRIKKPDGTYTYGTSAAHVASVNGTYTFVFEDVAGNTFTNSITVNNININAPTISITGLSEGVIRGTKSFSLNTNDLDAVDGVSYTLQAGSAPSQSNYNAYLGLLSGTTKGTSSVTFNLATFLPSELTWNAATSRFEKVVHLTGTISDGLKTATTNSSFVVYNQKPIVTSSIVDITTYRKNNNSIILSSYFNEPDGHGLSYTATSSNGSIASFSISGNTLLLNPLSVGTTTITVTASDGLGGTVSQAFNYKVSNYIPTLNVASINKTVAGVEDIIKVSGTIEDLDTDEVTISAMLGGKTATTSVVNGNGSWELLFKGEDVTEGTYTGLLVTATDAYDTVTKTFNFPTLTVDNSMPFFWAVTHTPNTPTAGEVSIQVNVGDTYLGVKELINPDGTKTTKVNSTYKVNANGTYEFTVVDRAGNSYSQTVEITNIDSVVPVITALTLVEKADKTYQVTAKATDASGIDSITLNNGTKLTKGDEDTYRVEGISTIPTYVTALDKSGNLSGNMNFLDMPTVNLTDYNAGGTQRDDVKGVINGSGILDFQIGSKKYSCTEKPCEITISKNTDVTVINKTNDKATIKTVSINNIDKTPVNIILDGVRNPDKPNEITFSWDEKLTNPLIICTTLGGEVKTITPDSNPFTFVGENQAYMCKLVGELDGKEIESGEFSIYPDYNEEVIQSSPSDSYDKKDLQFNTYVEKNTTGKTFYFNFNKDNTDEQVPIPSSLLK